MRLELQMPIKNIRWSIQFFDFLSLGKALPGGIIVFSPV